MAPSPNQMREARPPTQSVREAPFTLVRDTTTGGAPGDGLTLDGYGAVFNRLTVIDSWEGRFREQIALGSMKRSFRETPPIVQFDHGRSTPFGPLPIAELKSITEESDPTLAPDGGAHIVARLFDNWLVQPIRDAISAGAISGMSFRFSVVREAWETADGKPIRDDNQLMQALSEAVYDNLPEDQLPIRTLKELRVPEMGPVVWPAYADTSVGVRSIIDLGRLGDPDQRKLLARAVFIADRAEAEDSHASSPPPVIPPPRARAAAADADDDPAALAGALDAILDQAAALIADTDLTSLPPNVAQACNLIVAAETAADALLESMGVYDPDDDETGEPGRNKDVDAQQIASRTRPADEHPSHKEDAQRGTPECVAERPSKKQKPFTNHQLKVMNQRDRLSTFRQIGDRSQ